MNYRFLLFDLDHTLLDFETAEGKALDQLFAEQTLVPAQQLKDYYIPMNQQLWRDLEDKKISKQELVETRFARAFAYFGYQVDGLQLAENYQDFLGQHGDTYDGADQLLQGLTSRGYQLYAATNGIATIQKNRLADSGLVSYFQEIFISEEVGYQKPDRQFYSSIANQINHFDTKQALMIGDSLTADIKGGNNAGIDTLWYNPTGKQASPDVRVTYEAKNYRGILRLLTK